MTTPGEDQGCGDAKNQVSEFVDYISTDRVVDQTDPGKIAEINQDLICPICTNVLLNPQDCI